MLAPCCADETRRQATVSGPVHEIPHLAFHLTDADHGKRVVPYARLVRRKPSFSFDRSAPGATSAPEDVGCGAFWVGCRDRDPQISRQRHRAGRPCPYQGSSKHRGTITRRHPIGLMVSRRSFSGTKLKGALESLVQRACKAPVPHNCPIPKRSNAAGTTVKCCRNHGQLRLELASM